MVSAILPTSDAYPLKIDKPNTFCIRSMKKMNRVSFGHVKIFLHNIILGDNPSCSCGPPIQMDWTAHRIVKTTVDEFEKRRSGTNYRKRSEKEMLIPSFVRERKLRYLGVCVRDMHEIEVENILYRRRMMRNIAKYRRERKMVKILSTVFQFQALKS